jgi:hypothetical protein
MSLPDGLRVWLGFDVTTGEVADLADDPLDWPWTDATPWVYLDGAGVTIDVGYGEGSDEASPTAISFTGNHSDGRWAPGNPRGAWFGLINYDTPVKVTFDPGTGPVTRGIAYLSDLPQEWSAGGFDLRVPVKALGVLARLESADPLESYARRATLGNFDPPVAYWPLEDGRDSTRYASAVAGQPDGTTLFEMNLAADSDFGGSKPLPQLTATGYHMFTIAPYERTTPEAWAVQMAVRIPERPVSTIEFGMAVISETSTVRRWVFEITNATPSVLYLRGYNAAGAEVLGDPGLLFDSIGNSFDREPFGDQMALEIRAMQNGADIDWQATYWHQAGNGAVSLGTVAGATLGPVGLMVTGGGGGLDGHTVAHYAAFALSTPNGFSSAAAVANGGDGEQATVRFNVQASYGGVWAEFANPAGDPMGFVPTDTLVGILRECPTFDGGLMFERANGRLMFRPLVTLLNQTPAWSVSYQGQVKSLEPVAAIRDYINRVTVDRVNGSAATADGVGPLAPVRRPVRSRPVTVNAQSDLNLKYHAQWAAAVGSCPDDRYTLGLQLHAGAAGKLAAWLATDVGDRVQVTDPPEWIPETIDQYVRGWSERINRIEYEATVRLMPYRPYRAFVVESTDGNLGKADTSGCRLLAAVTSSATSAIVGTYGRPAYKTGHAAKWSTTSLPYDLALRDVERVRCTAVTNNAPTFVAAGTASHGDNASLTPALPAGLTVGDLLLCLAAIRDDTGARPLTPDGWVRLAMFGLADNVQLFARQYRATDTAPTVEFANGAAGDSTTAQLCAFRYLQPVLHNRALRLSNAASSTTITTPDLGVIRNGCVIIVAGWMKDDWTSVAPPAGMTEIGEPDTALGGDHGATWAYQIQTTATRVAASSFTITGGTSAVSKAGAVAVLGDVQTLTLTRGINGVQIAHRADDAVNLWRGGVVRRP